MFPGQVGEIAFGTVFFGEMALKVWAYGWRDYWRSNQNKFDFAVTWCVCSLNVD
jgi:hypothetical protein